jgi:hypothetical protein
MTNESGAAAPTSTARPRWGIGLWVLAVLVVGAIGLGAGHQWGLYDRAQLGADLVAAGGPSSTPSPSSSEPSPSSSTKGAAAAPACKSVAGYVRDVVRRSDLTAEHPAQGDDGMTACRWVSETYPRISVSVVAGRDLGDDVVAVLDDTFTEPAPMTNPRMYQYSGGALTGYWTDPDDRSLQAAAVLDGMNATSLPSDEGMAATSLAARVAQAHRDR